MTSLLGLTGTSGSLENKQIRLRLQREMLVQQLRTLESVAGVRAETRRMLSTWFSVVSEQNVSLLARRDPG